MNTKSVEYPFKLLERWLEFARAKYVTNNLPNYNAAILSTISSTYQPKSRVILIKHIDTSGLIFYTNYHSKKAEEIDFSNKVSLVFYWGLLGLQIRIEGEIAKVSAEVSDKYFKSRPYLSKINAIASKQSSVLSNPLDLEKTVTELSNIYKNEVPRPNYWGGYKIIPNYFEFWKEGSFRQHRRMIYKISNNISEEFRLYP
ncbi:pyridoxamine 5'-phosphate oxidase [Rickettsiales bacterium LUAb2]